MRGKKITGTAKAGSDLISDEQYVVAVAYFAHPNEQFMVMKPHPASALNYGFNEEGDY